jgi:hypothetical protein
MPGGSRSLPGRPNLRHLKLEAKRRATAGEFPTLHEAQVAIARQRGLPTWAALKQRVSTEQESYARTRRSTRRPNRARAVIAFVITGLIAVAAWVAIARACRNGSNGARITGTVLFGLATVDTLVSAVAPQAVAVKAWWPVIWLAGLIAVILLWQRASTAFFKGIASTAFFKGIRAQGNKQ